MIRRSNNSSFIGVIICAIIVSLWFVNMAKFIQLDFEEPYKAEIIRGVGVPVWPMGIIISLIELDEEKSK